MKTKLLLIAILVIISHLSFAQKSLLQSGPMIGYSQMQEVMLWVQTKEKANVKIFYQNTDSLADKHWTNTVTTEKNHGFTAHLLADKVEAGQKYNYTLYINNKRISFPYQTQFQTLKVWKWRGDAYDFSFATGSGAYINEKKYDRPGKGFGGDYIIYTQIPKKKPDFMLWLGDNVYLREADWNSKTGIYHRYTHTRSTPEMQELLATTHNYAIWDDHDYGDNDSDKSFWKKNTTLDAFEDFWANPSYGVAGIKGAISFFEWSDCDFFMLDNRFYRDPNKLIANDKTMLGETQLEWLKIQLLKSRAAFKFVVIGGQFLCPTGLFETYSNYGFAKERQEIIDFIQNNKIENVVFLTGDRHHSEIDVLKRVNTPTIYDITISAFTSKASHKIEQEVNVLRVNGSLINVRNFATINLSGKYKNRVLTANFFDKSGKEIYKYEIKQESRKDYMLPRRSKLKKTDKNDKKDK